MDFTAFGLMYLVWGIRHSIRNKPHKHIHFHGTGDMHMHKHTHHDEHLHVHENKDKQNITPWILFTIFIFGPCEPLIPLVMYPAAKHNYNALLLVTIIFSVVTILTMLSLVLITSYGIKFLPIKVMEKYNHALAGGTIFLCGMGMLFLVYNTDSPEYGGTHEKDNYCNFVSTNINLCLSVLHIRISSRYYKGLFLHQSGLYREHCRSNKG